MTVTTTTSLIYFFTPQVSFFAPWISCVVAAARGGAGQQEVAGRCDPVAEALVPDCLQQQHRIFDTLDLRSEDETFSIKNCE